MFKKSLQQPWQDPLLPTELRVCHRLAHIMDEAFRIPILGKRVGLDALVGLIPGLGDALSLLIALIPVGVGLYWRLPWPTVVAMLGAVLVDAFVGSIPLLGDVFDAGFKANRHNARLLHKAWERHKQPGASQAVVDI